MPSIYYWRRGRDSNPRDPAKGLTVFKTVAFNHSATPPEEVILSRGATLLQVAEAEVERYAQQYEWKKRRETDHQ